VLVYILEVGEGDLDRNADHRRILKLAVFISEKMIHKTSYLRQIQMQRITSFRHDRGM